jgi:hypothetical protein
MDMFIPAMSSPANADVATMAARVDATINLFIEFLLFE